MLLEIIDRDLPRLEVRLGLAEPRIRLGEKHRLDPLQSALGVVVFPVRQPHLRGHAPFHRFQFCARLADVALGASDVSLIAVEDRQGEGQPHRPRSGVGPLDGAIVLDRDRVVEKIDIVDPVGALEIDLRPGSVDAEPNGADVGAASARQPNHLVERRGLRGDWPQPAAGDEIDRLPRRHPQQQSERLLGILEGLVRIERRELRLLEREAELADQLGGLAATGHVGGRQRCRLAGLLRAERLGPTDRGLGGEPIDPRRLEVDEGLVDVVDLAADDILELRFQRRLRHPGHDRPRLPLPRDVERVGDIEIVLRRPARRGVGERAVGDELAVEVNERIGSQAGGEDVGVGLRQLVAEGADVDVVGHHPLDGDVEREAVRRPLVVGETPVELAGADRQAPCRRRRCGERLRELHAAGGLEPDGARVTLPLPRQSSRPASATDDPDIRVLEAPGIKRPGAGAERRRVPPRDRPEIGKLDDPAAGGIVGIPLPGMRRPAATPGEDDTDQEQKRGSAPRAAWHGGASRRTPGPAPPRPELRRSSSRIAPTANQSSGKL